MSLNSTPQSVRVHIGLFGKRNAGKSSIINAITNQSAAIVSDIAGTTTDPVFRPMEILPIGPCVLIDTAGLDDVGELGELRIGKSLDGDRYSFTSSGLPNWYITRRFVTN
ncbi:50S ribosome-binding GTPase family protein [Clostridioides difficile DA00165]|nr:50S ribosome-binding GTPase family protein [Clostridioides difficile DA00165]